MSRKTPPSGSPRREHGTPSRWDQYRELLVAKRIPQKSQRWYVTQVEQFLGAVQPNSLKGLSADEITGYLHQTSSPGKWQDWQFRQMVDALGWWRGCWLRGSRAGGFEPPARDAGWKPALRFGRQPARGRGDGGGPAIVWRVQPAMAAFISAAY